MRELRMIPGFAVECKEKRQRNPVQSVFCWALGEQRAGDPGPCNMSECRCGGSVSKTAVHPAVHKSDARGRVAAANYRRRYAGRRTTWKR